ncbi:head maturation protease, ClpP-related [Agarilytica rhodophyticola]|uniref:head maturation protease, ClpP-related n=1 Tax=Agarilytica rhodophyticola TaxID=1737490 RepID=UPI000B345352|nr:head maturation protease, ClpP-related [Agarilytica rhodophyticola]
MHQIFKAFGKSVIQLSPTAFINTQGQLIIYGIIGDWFDGLDAASVVQAIDELSGDKIEIRINSPGGSVIDGLVMYNYLKSIDKEVICYIDGLAASMACALAMACDQVFIPSNAMMMMHKPNFADLIGQFNANDLRDLAMQLDTIEPSYIQLHADKTGKSTEEIAALLSDGKDHYFRGQQAVDYGLADFLIEPMENVPQARIYDSQRIKPGVSIPSTFLKKAAGAALNNQELFMFQLKSSADGVDASLLQLIANALAEKYAGVEEAAAALSELGVTADMLTGAAEMPMEVISALASELGVSASGEDTEEPTAATDERNVSSASALSSRASVVSAVSAGTGRNAVIAERQRISGLREIAAKANFGDSDATLNQWIDNGISVDSARAKAFDIIAKRSAENLPASGTIRTGGCQDIRKAVATAMLARANPERYKHNDNSREFRGMSMLNIVREMAAYSGTSLRGKGVNDVVASAFSSTSDFPAIVEDVANKVLLDKYREKPKTFTEFARRSSSTDFKENHSVMVGNGQGLLPVGENGEFKDGTVSESEESYKLKTFGRTFSFGRQLLINDNLKALTQFMSGLGGLASRNESRVFYELLNSNPRLKQNNRAMFHASNGNLIDADTVELGIDNGRKALAKQKGLDGDYIDVVASYLLVSPDRLTEAQKVLSAVQATTTGDVNVFANSLSLIEEVRLAGVDNDPFYIFASPNDAPAFEYSYLEGEEEPYLETQEGFNVDGIKIKVRHDFAAGVIDYRGVVKVSGVAAP